MEKWKGADEFPLECQVGMKAERDGSDHRGSPRAILTLSLSAKPRTLCPQQQFPTKARSPGTHACAKNFSPNFG